MQIGSAVAQCLTLERRAAGSSLAGIIALCPLERHINPSLVLVQPRKTRLDVNERLLTGTYIIKSNKQIVCKYKVSILGSKIAQIGLARQ